MTYMKVPQLSPWVGKEEYRAIKDCFDNNWITEGPKAGEFTKELLNLIKAKYGVFAPNGTLALYLGLRALGIKAGDEVLVPDFTFYASATSVEMCGAKPVFVEVNRKNFQIDVRLAEKWLTKKTKAIMPVHIYGTSVEMDSVVKFSKKHNLLIIEDAAESLGVSYKGKHTGTFGQVGCFSFFADKTITTAEGGFVVTNDYNIYENLLYLRNQGRVDRGSFIHPKIGYNFRMTDIQCAIGLVQLRKLDAIKKRKLEILKMYKKLLKNIKEVSFFEEEQDANFIPFRVCILHPKARELMGFMKEKGIETRTFFYPLHNQPQFKNTKIKDSEFPNSNYGYDHGVCLPVFPALQHKQIEYICETIKQFNAK